ncbi:MAG: GGDEF domain-containing protein [Kiritimatiellia bacterium]
MDFAPEIARFVTEAIGGIYVVEESTRIIAFADAFVERLYGPALVGKCAADVFPWEARSLHAPLSHAEAMEWECVDRERGIYWRLHHGLFDKDGVVYKIGQLTNTTEYMLLSQEVTEYSVLSEKVSAFQSAMLEKISASHSALLPVIAGFFKTPRLYFFLARNGQLETTAYDALSGAETRGRQPLAPAHDAAFGAPGRTEFEAADLAEPVQAQIAARGGEPRNRFVRICAGTFSNQRFALYLELDERSDRKALDIPILATIINLCVENSLLREEIVYESEHDKLTGLYNKGKYLARLRDEYPRLDSVAIFNFDVNSLKQTNDVYGHEAGDKLLLKAAESIRKVTSENVHGYRLGGDEYLMVACNGNAEDVAALKARWEESLAEVNRAGGDGIPCIVAVGTAFAAKPYDFAELMKLADARMYEDKRLKKKPGEEIR